MNVSLVFPVPSANDVIPDFGTSEKTVHKLYDSFDSFEYYFILFLANDKIKSLGFFLGCEKCGCNTDYAVGSGCNQETGQCTCLDGVVGQNCDRCPKDWVLVVNETRTGVLVSIYYIKGRSNHFQKIMNNNMWSFYSVPNGNYFLITTKVVILVLRV